MTHMAEMLGAHPSAGNMSGLPELIDKLTDCALACIVCADACVAEDHVASLRKCIRLTLDCADISQSAARVLARQTEYESTIARSVLEACLQACRRCADECERHAHMNHCKLCAEVCRDCEQACRELLQALPTAAA